MKQDESTYVLHDSKLSGNAWKVRLLMSHLGQTFRRVTYTLPEGKTRLSNFLQMNPIGKVPVLVLPDGNAIFESAAIMCHLAEGSPLLPGAGLRRTEVLQWLFFEQAEALKPLAAARFWLGIAKKPEARAQEIPGWHTAGEKVLGILNARLASRDFLAADCFTIADIANFPYVAMSPEGGFDLTKFPNVESWIARIKRQPGYVPLIDETESAGAA